MANSISLRKVYLFNHISDERLAEIEQVLKRHELAQGEILFNINDPGDELYIVEQGRIAIFAPDAERPGQEQPIRIFEKEDALGEMALIDRKPRSLSARAIEPSVVLGLGVQDFRRLVVEDPDLAFGVMDGLSDRIRYTTEFLSEVREWVGRVSKGDYQTLEKVRGWMKSVAEGNVEDITQDEEEYQDEMLSALAAEFAHMASQVKHREETLKKEIQELKIAINETERKKAVSEAAKNLDEIRARAKALREEMARDAE